MVQTICGTVSEGSLSRAVSPERMNAVITTIPPTEMAAHHCTATAFTALLAVATLSMTPALLVMSTSASNAMATGVRRRRSVERTTSRMRCQREGVRKVGAPARAVGWRVDGWGCAAACNGAWPCAFHSRRVIARRTARYRAITDRRELCRSSLKKGECRQGGQRCGLGAQHTGAQRDRGKAVLQCQVFLGAGEPAFGAGRSE